MSTEVKNTVSEKKTENGRVRLCAPNLKPEGKNLREMLDCYCRVFRPNLAAYLNLFKKKNLAFAISHAAGAVCPCCNKRHPHQRRLPKTVLTGFTAKLTILSVRIGKAKNFEELHEILGEARNPGIGPVTLYDAALRIGACISVLPRDLVYFHGGAVIPGGRKSGRVAISSFHRLFAEHAMTAYEIEEFLCCFNDLLKKTHITILNERRK